MGIEFKEVSQIDRIEIQNDVYFMDGHSERLHSGDIYKCSYVPGLNYTFLPVLSGRGYTLKTLAAIVAKLAELEAACSR